MRHFTRTSDSRLAGASRRVAIATGCAVLFLSGLVRAEAPPGRDFTIAPQALASALVEFSKQADVQVVGATESIGARHSPGVVGHFTAGEALERLLRDTDLSSRWTGVHTVTIAPRAGIAPARDTTATVPQKDPIERVLIAQAENETPAKSSDKDRQTKRTEKPAPRDAQLEEIIVTGSRIPLAAGQQTQPVHSYTRENIERSGQTSIADFLNTLPDVSLSSDDSNLLFNTFPGRRAVRLHGLPVGTTLLLLNGRRVESNFNGFFDVNSVPAAAVERVDILPVGASAIYGADALGGAVNIILRKDLNGFEASAKTSHFTGAHDTGGNLAWGRSWDNGAVSLVGTYQDIGKLDATQRELTSSIDFPAGAPTAGYVNDECSPGNVYSLNGQNLPGLSAPQAGIPAGISGRPTLAQLAATAGKLNQCNYLRGFTLIPHSQREGVLLSGHYQPTESTDFFIETLLSHERLETTNGFRIDAVGGSFGLTILGANNPYNPFGEDVGVSFVYPGFQNRFDESSTLVRPLIGVRGALFSQWHYEVTAFLSRDRFAAHQDAFLDFTTQQMALESSDPATALNPFTTGAPGTPQAVQSLLATAGPQYPYRFRNQVLDGQFIIRGPLFHLPAGPVEAAIGGEYSREQQETELALFAPLDLRRRSYAAYTEARIPLITDHDQSRLTLNVAGRYDHTNDFGGKATWQGGLHWQATSALSLNGSYGISYKAPALQEIGGALSTSPNYGGLVDPFRGGEAVSGTYLFGGNPNLKPETGSSRTLELAFTNEAHPGFEASLAYFSINITNYISIPNNQTEIDNPAFYPGAVVRAAPTAADLQQGFPGKITQISNRSYNFGDLRVAGFDAAVSCAIDSALGTFKPALALANIDRWDSALAPGAPLVSTVSQANIGLGYAPRWKGTAALAWLRGPLSASVSGRYTGRYKDYQEAVPNSNELGNFWLFDIHAQYQVGQSLAQGNRWLTGTYVALGAINLFDKAPQFSYGYITYDSTQYDIRGRIVYAQIGVKW